MNLPESIVEIIMHGFLDKNQLEFLLGKSIEILQIAIIMEKSSRRIFENNKNIFKYNKRELVSYILSRAHGSKFMKSYIEKAEKNSSAIEKLKIDDIISLNNGFSHKYYLLKNIKDNEYYCISLKEFSLKHQDIEFAGVRVSSYNETIVTKSNMQTAILLKTHSLENLIIRNW
jgi:hypothetical protein